MTKRALVIREMDTGGFSFETQDMRNPIQTPNGPAPYVEDGAKESAEGMLEKVRKWLAVEAVPKEGRK